MKKFRLILYFLFSLSFLEASQCYYEVQIQGVEDDDAYSQLQSASQLIALEDHPPSSPASLKKRAEKDVSNLILALHSLAYFNAKVDIDYDFRTYPAIVFINVDTGPVYPLECFNIIPKDELSECACSLITYKDIKACPGCPAYPKTIVEAEGLLKLHLAKNGYPLASIEKREVIADQKTKFITVNLFVDSGPLAYFGETSLSGETDVLDLFFCRKIAWQEGQVYDPALIARTSSSLEASGLFTIVNITHAEEVDEEGRLPITIQVEDSKHCSIGAGISYATDFGIGVMGEWELRNICRVGERLSMKASYWQRKQEASVLFVQPNFYHRDQDLLWQALVDREWIDAFDETSISVSATIVRRLSERWKISYGGMIKYIHTSHSDNNRDFNLVKTPMQINYSRIKNLLDPTKGRTFSLRIVPSYEVTSPQFFYCINLFTGTVYVPLNKSRRFVLAGKVVAGTIWGASDHSIPPPERFYGGSDSTLRGYTYQTVSPLDRDHDPIGGRSILAFSLEARARLTDTWGLVTFYDIGNVYKSPWPRVTHKQLQSTGFGIRYYTPVGPLRADIAFPLNPRRHVDHRFQVYVGVGQDF